MAGLDRDETRKDTIQVALESGATHVGRIATIISGAVREVVGELGEFATDVFEMREASRRAAADRGAEAIQGEGEGENAGGVEAGRPDPPPSSPA
jgi:hypothetical protein